MVHNVVIIGGICILPLKPLKTTRGSIIKTSDTARLKCIWCCRPTLMAVVKASNDSTEISKPPPIITNVVPIAVIPIIELILEYVENISP